MQILSTHIFDDLWLVRLVLLTAFLLVLRFFISNPTRLLGSPSLGRSPYRLGQSRLIFIQASHLQVHQSILDFFVTPVNNTHILLAEFSGPFSDIHWRGRSPSTCEVGNFRPEFTVIRAALREHYWALCRPQRFILSLLIPTVKHRKMSVWITFGNHMRMRAL
jgi:hypothetical protein